MKLEARDHPIVYTWPGGEVRLEPGRPIDLPDDRALKLLIKAGSKVRVVEPEKRDWLSAWTHLASMTAGIAKTDPRFVRIIQMLEKCDQCFAADDWNGFQRAAEGIRGIVATGS